MSSISLSRIPRRIQLLLLAVVVLAVLWVAVLHKVVNSSSSSSETATVAAKPKPAAPLIHRPAAPAHLSRTAPKAAVHPLSRSAPQTSVHHPATVAPRLGARPRPATPARVAPRPAPKRVAPAKPAAAQAVERELGEGKVVMLVVYDPEATTDRLVAGEARALAARDHGVALHLLTPAELGAYGTYTAKALITETPTVLVLSGNGRASELTGYAEGPVLEEAVALARQGGR